MLDDIVWAVNPGNDSMPEILARMRRYASRTWEETGIDFNIEVDENTQHVKLNMEQRGDIYLVFKEAVNNVAKHAQCRHAKTIICSKNNILFIKVKDDGKGFNTSVPLTRNGLKNIKSRVQKWKGAYSVFSSPENGTCISLRLPITQKR